MSEFNYLLDKIANANFTTEPYEHIIIDNFLNEEHFNQITKCEEIDFPKFNTSKALIDFLLENGYEIQQFPGCITDVKKYLYHLEKGEWPVDKGLLEGFGMTFRLIKYKSEIIQKLYNFLQSNSFKKCLEDKLNLQAETDLSTGIQKYLNGYEISPHPDQRNKAATYMLNINTSPNSEQEKIHTYLMKFKKEKQYIYDFWANNHDTDRCWVPWEWCDTVAETTKNNSIIIFAPCDYSLHAVKLNYDHLSFQRTQLYGNLFYKDIDIKYWPKYQDLDIKGMLAKKNEANGFKNKILNKLNIRY